jgi:transketolase
MTLIISGTNFQKDQEINMKVASNKIKDLENLSSTIRVEVLQMLNNAGSGHPGGSLSSLDILVNLYFSGFLNINKNNHKSNTRDLVILSAGHYCPTLYAILSYKGLFSKKILKTLRKFDSPLLGHPKLYSLPGVENSGGSLGQGISLACGYAIAAKNFAKKKIPKVYCLMGDGEQNEGQVWEAAMFAAHNKLNNLCAIVDINKIQIDGYTKDIMNAEPLKKKYQSFNWHTIRINGNDHKSISEAFKKFLNYKGTKPTIILADTLAGKGLKSIEGLVSAHGQPITLDHIKEIKYKN